MLSSRSVAMVRNELEPLHVTILDRYLVAEFLGPALLGGAAFTLIFIATQFLAIGRLVTQDHLPFWIAIEYFLWEMPAYLLLVIPMAMLFGTLLSIGRLSGESEIAAASRSSGCSCRWRS
jgi:lipopolysaccharide export system permease protein